ncbi:DUF3108 domain-containing protein [Aestuariibaculum suncheonense]|uniref:DUF3108 domain-containing protein n=1 Tax=Aestuariibaculum suncheonense TaxID=1028745 RepID=A0A8J6Q6L0_9FLAO|nr:DUF3108 domain-containing protein [Aestuariibaculum suncheonense]MBD0835159.1 DUF3108 domain-containing protein [Aestuariibaculum suncheonense]
MKRIPFLFMLLLAIVSANAQNTAVGYNEKLTYTASYNMSGVLNDIAQVTMETSPVKTSKATLLRLKCTAVTYSKWDNFFKIRDLYESYVSPKTLTPYLYSRDINEGGYYKYMKYTFSHSTGTVKSLMKKKNNFEENKTVKINAGTKDIVSTIYNLRLIDFSTMKVGAKKSFTIIFDREETKGQVTYLGKETINTAIGKKECYKLAVGSSDNVLQGTDNNLIWLTADANKILVYGKFKIPVGNGELKIKSATGLKN